MWRSSAGYLDELPLKNLDPLSRILEGIATATKVRRNSVPIIPASLPRADIALFSLYARNQGTRVTESRLSQIEVWWRMIMLIFCWTLTWSFRPQWHFPQRLQQYCFKNKNRARSHNTPCYDDCSCQHHGVWLWLRWIPRRTISLSLTVKRLRMFLWLRKLVLFLCWCSCSFDLNDTNCQYSFDFECMLWCT